MSQFLDFTLYSFKGNVKFTKTKLSSRLFPLSNIIIKFDKVLELKEISSNKKILGDLSRFKDRMDKYGKKQMKSLLDPLSEIVSINPSHSSDKLLADKIFIKIFWQYWNMLTREEQ
jgi:hypothetical protein